MEHRKLCAWWQPRCLSKGHKNWHSEVNLSYLSGLRKWVHGIVSGRLYNTSALFQSSNRTSSNELKMPNSSEKKKVSLCWKNWGICIMVCRSHPHWIHASGYNNWHEYLPQHVVMHASGYPLEENWASLKRRNPSAWQCNPTQHTGIRISAGISTFWQSTIQSWPCLVKPSFVWATEAALGTSPIPQYEDVKIAIHKWLQM
jgi:hypothetical protein